MIRKTLVTAGIALTLSSGAAMAIAEAAASAAPAIAPAAVYYHSSPDCVSGPASPC